MPGTSDSVKVAVRVRPFNQREKNAGSKCVISMKGNSTSIENPENGDVKSFSFDHSYWSHDDFSEDENGIYHAEGPKYADQRQVFSDLGQGVLDNAWQGYNAALFAYGQTGSGKSYSMIGYGPNKGIVPILCEELFKAIEGNNEKDKQLQVTFSMLEIYNEQVRDLLVKGKAQAGGLKIRQNPKSGFYVEGLKQVPVRNYKEIEKLMEQGTVNRTTASTNMNATSSRSHMVITIRFAQVFKNESGQSNTRSSDINLVDLAGSERADSTGATGDRLKEGSAINQSLSTLGNVISALADLAMGKKKVLVPYRDSVLTKLLQSALGGNSRTIMIAALSPAAINYEETLSTLRYADRAKKIQNKAVVNESPTERLIRELKEENAKLLAMLQKGGKGGGSDTVEGRKELQRMLEENQKKMQDMDLSWEQRLEDARKEWERSFGQSSESSKHSECLTLPYIRNINEDPQLSGVIKSPLQTGKTVLGKDASQVDIQIRGLGIQPKHAVIHNTEKGVFIEPVGKSQIFLSGHRIKEKSRLQHLDRIKVGSTSLFLYVGHASERSSSDQIEQFNYDYFMMELAEHEGVAVDLHTPRAHETTDDSHTTKALQDYVDIMPLISEANAISDELGKGVYFDAEIKSEASHDPRGIATGREVIVRVTNKQISKIWIWPRSKFLHRKDLMDEMYWKFQEEGSKTIVKKDKDPFWDPVEDIFLGSCHVMLQCLSYCIEIDEHFALHNYHGKEEAVIHIQVQPCDAKGNLLEEDDIVEPAELVGKPFHLTIQLPQYMGVRWTKEDNSRGVYCKYTFWKTSAMTNKIIGKSSAEFDYRKDFAIPKVTQEFLHYLQTHSLVLELWGTQVDGVNHKMNGHSNGHNTLPGDDEVSKLKLRESILTEECEDLKKENFKLKQSLDRQKQAVALTRTRKVSTDMGRKTSVSEVNNNNSQATGLDVELAKALKLFFKDVRGVQQQLRNIKQNAAEVVSGSGQNGNVKSALKDQEKNIQEVDEQLNSCVQSLKQTVAMTLKKSKS